jgi:hypothetical protein
MIELVGSSATVLSEGGMTVTRTQLANRDALLFEDGTVLGFLFAYETVSDLLDRWRSDAAAAVAESQFRLRRAGPKAWNAYVVLLSGGAADQPATIALSAIEEDLVGTRKIARAEVTDMVALVSALLSLLPLQHAPQLEGVDSAVEIRKRATELTQKSVDAFLSSADDAVVLSILEESS